jgi:hypothetical protein
MSSGGEAEAGDGGVAGDTAEATGGEVAGDAEVGVTGGVGGTGGDGPIDRTAGSMEVMRATAMDTGAPTDIAGATGGVVSRTTASTEGRS